MTPYQVWSAYLASIGESAATTTLTCRPRRFSDRPKDADELATLVLTGQKRATAPCVAQFVAEPLPVPGDHFVVTDGSDNACCVIRTTRVRIVPYRDVPIEFIQLEGEGDGTVESWRSVHWPYYQRVLESIGRAPSETMPIVCQEFVVVYADGVRTEYLADHIAVLPTLQGWFETEWPEYYGPDGPGDASADLAAYANRVGLPIGLVALARGALCGVAVLRSSSIDTHPHLTPWAAGGLVVPEYRRQGIGARLLDGLERLAKDLGFDRIYCGTNTAVSLLERNGWVYLDRASQGRQTVSIYTKALR